MFGLLGIVVLALAGLSPFLLDAAYSGTRMDWARLSDIGETFGAISALLSATALVALGMSLALQAREVRHAREQAARSAQFELMRLILEEPVYQEVLGRRLREGLTKDELRRDIYLNLLINWWQMRWEFKDMPEVEVREAARLDLFSAEAGRDYWRRRGEARLSYANSRRGRRFNEIFDAEYRAAMVRVEDEEADEEPVSQRAVTLAARARQAGVAVLLLVAGAVAGSVFRRLRAHGTKSR
ncbi:hypothetical protein ETD83_01580 [Actinomadura soli]|uniref:Uncharacterized protein n=1 Tax=Actinomadura soli TaxID=2508997 RepID=A0A5C4JKG5_9ACTN|nr:DUF6082 family protein [Actinomadura soli]TMR07138.1 hypothetical protein ETD83_01580 [Actinomadura soli]